MRALVTVIPFACANTLNIPKDILFNASESSASPVWWLHGIPKLSFKKDGLHCTFSILVQPNTSLLVTILPYFARQKENRGFISPANDQEHCLTHRCFNYRSVSEALLKHGPILSACEPKSPLLFPSSRRDVVLTCQYLHTLTLASLLTQRHHYFSLSFSLSHPLIPRSRFIQVLIPSMYS
jgi:hypothetical protein